MSENITPCCHSLMYLSGIQKYLKTLAKCYVKEHKMSFAANYASQGRKTIFPPSPFTAFSKAISYSSKGKR